MESHTIEIDYSLRFFFLSRNAGQKRGLAIQIVPSAAFALDCRLLDLLRARRYSPFGGEPSHASRQTRRLHHS